MTIDEQSLRALAHRALTTAAWPSIRHEAVSTDEAVRLLCSAAPGVGFTQAHALVCELLDSRVDLGDVAPLFCPPDEVEAIHLAREDRTPGEILLFLMRDHGVAPARAEELVARVQGMRPTAQAKVASFLVACRERAAAASGLTHEQQRAAVLLHERHHRALGRKGPCLDCPVGPPRGEP